MSFSVRQRLHTAEEAEAAIACIENWPACDERDDRLIEIAALRLEHLWERFGAPETCPPWGRGVMLVLESKRMFAVNLRMDRTSRRRQAQDLEDDKIINWHQDVFHGLLTCDHILGSRANADLFRAAMLNRFSEDGTPASIPPEYRCVKLGSTLEPLLKLLSSPNHLARATAAELCLKTRAIKAASQRRRI